MQAELLRYFHSHLEGLNRKLLDQRKHIKRLGNALLTQQQQQQQQQEELQRQQQHQHHVDA